jgi:gas vesicle protein
MEKSKKAIGAGLALAAIAAAATYFLTGKRGAENREKIAAWTLKMKAEVLEKMKKMKDIDKEKYHALVDEVAKRYERVGRVSAEEMKHLTAEVKSAWTHISKQLKA